MGAEARNGAQAATEAAAAVRCSEGCGYRRRSCHRRCGGAAAAARRGLSAGTAPLSAAGPAHCRRRPRPPLPRPPASCGASPVRGGASRPATLDHAHPLGAPPTTGLRPYLGANDRLSAALAPPRSPGSRLSCRVLLPREARILCEETRTAELHQACG